MLSNYYLKRNDLVLHYGIYEYNTGASVLRDIIGKLF